MESYIAIVVSLILFIMFGYFFSRIARKVEIVSQTVEASNIIDKKKKTKVGLRKSIKTVIKAFKSLMKQKPEIYENITQLQKFNIVVRDENDKYKIYVCDEVIGKELIEAIEELGVDFAIEKWL